MPRSPSAPSDPYLKCSSSFVNTSFSSRKNFVHVKKAPSARRIAITAAETQMMRFVLGCSLIGLLIGFGSKGFQILDDCVFFLGRQHRPVGWPFVTDI